MRHSLLLIFATVGLALNLLVVGSAAAQLQEGIRPGDVLTGTVLFDGAPAPDLPVELHHITNIGAGMSSEGATDEAGRFRFTLEPDTTATTNVFFVTAEKSGIRYFGSPVHAGLALPEDYRFEVFDTASSAPLPVKVPVRDVFLAALPDGAWEVNDWIRISNENRVSLVAPTGVPTFEIRIPASATDFEVGEGSILPNEISRMDDRVMMVSPVTPGTRDLLVRYRLPPRPTRATFPIGQPTDTMNLYVLQPSHLSEVIGLPRLNSIPFEGDEYLRYSGSDLAPDSRVDLAWSGALSAPINPIVAAVTASILLLLAGAFFAFRAGAPQARI